MVGFFISPRLLNYDVGNGNITILFFSIRGFAAHREKFNPYFSSDEDFLIPHFGNKIPILHMKLL
jgi:hypothetical protein